MKSIKPVKSKKSAWLITWEPFGGEVPALTERVIAIRDGRVSPKKIKDFVEQHYISVCYSLHEKMHYSSHPTDNPYPANYETDSSGRPSFACGHNPFIIARIVKNLRLYKGESCEIDLTWD